MKRQGLGIRGLGVGIMAGLLFAPCSSGTARADTAQQQTPSLKITVLVSDYARVPRGILAGAVRQTMRIFHEAGIETAWVNCTAPAPETQVDAACFQPLRPTYLVLRIHPRFQDADGIFRDTTLGFSLLAAERGRSAHASIFYDYVEDLANTGDASRDQILGHAIAHEFGHLLLGTMGHSPTGLMRARWDRADLLLATVERLTFTPQQSELIRADVQARMRLQEATLAPSIASQK
jgi:hypothetical protein